MRLFTCILLVSLVTISHAEIKSGSDGKDVVSVSDQQSQMIAAMQKGIATIDRLFESLQSGDPAHSRHGVKIAYSENQQTEYLWVYDLSADKEGLFGVLGNNPYYAKSIKIGDIVRIKPDDVVDWSCVNNGVLVGGYTLRVMFEQYDVVGKKQIQEQLGYKIIPE